MDRKGDMTPHKPAMWITIGCLLLIIGGVVWASATQAESLAQQEAFNNMGCLAGEIVGAPTGQGCEQESSENFGARKFLGASASVAGIAFLCMGGGQVVRSELKRSSGGSRASFWFPSESTSPNESASGDHPAHDELGPELQLAAEAGRGPHRQSSSVGVQPSVDRSRGRVEIDESHQYDPVPHETVASPRADIPRQHCPRCGEMIATVARMCRFCQLDLNPDTTTGGGTWDSRPNS